MNKLIKNSLKTHSEALQLINESDSTQRIQEMHILIGHILCDIIEKKS